MYSRQSALRPVAIAFVAALLLAGLGQTSLSAAKPVIHLHVFLSPDCPTCEPVKEEVLKKRARELGCEITPRYFDVEVMENYRILVAFEHRFADTENDLPVVVIGDRLLGGVEEIKAKLPGLLTELAATGADAVPLPTAEEIARAVRLPTVTRTIHATFFDRPGCRQCARASHILTHYQRELGTSETGEHRLVVERVAGEDRNARLWHEVLGERLGLPEDRRLVTPSLFVGTDALVERKITDAAVTGLLLKYRTGVPAPRPASQEELTSARARLNARFLNMGLATVLAGGLIDGINPCAFVTLIFLIGYLTATGRRGREILLVGSAFTAAVFASYLLMGVGIAGALEALEALPRIARVFHWGLVVLSFTLAGLSAWDLMLVLRGKGGQVKLVLPEFLRRRVSLTVAREFRTRTVVVAALVTGVLVSLFELVCTGQIYLPIIRLMASFSSTRLRALSFLVGYNVAFTVPLVVTFVAVYAGSTSQQLTELLHRHLALSKLLTTLLFLAMGVLLVLLR